MVTNTHCLQSATAGLYSIEHPLRSEWLMTIFVSILSERKLKLKGVKLSKITGLIGVKPGVPTQSRCARGQVREERDPAGRTLLTGAFW